MQIDDRIEATSATGGLDNAEIGENALIELDVYVGFRYHRDCGPARIGKGCTLRKGTVIYGDVDIGDHFITGMYVVIRAAVKIGDYCTVLNHSALEGVVRMGTVVRIMTSVYIPSRTWIGDHVFIGPGVTFLNDKFPGRRDPMPEPRGAAIEDDVMIGGDCTILPEVTIGERSFIAAGTVVDRDIPPRSLVRRGSRGISPLPKSIDRPNSRDLTIQPIDLWHPRGAYDAP